MQDISFFYGYSKGMIYYIELNYLDEPEEFYYLINAYKITEDGEEWFMVGDEKVFYTYQEELRHIEAYIQPFFPEMSNSILMAVLDPEYVTKVIKDIEKYRPQFEFKLIEWYQKERVRGLVR